jgi:hypothetical protein
VNDISGMPIMDVRSDTSVLMGSSTAPSLNSTKKVVSTGVQAFALGGTLIPTSSYDGAFFEYMAKSGSNARSGEVIAVWNQDTATFTDVSTLDLGNTAAVSASVSIVSSQMQFNFQTNTSGWTIKSTATLI